MTGRVGPRRSWVPDCNLGHNTSNTVKAPSRGHGRPIQMGCEFSKSVVLTTSAVICRVTSLTLSSHETVNEVRLQNLKKSEKHRYLCLL